MGTAAQWALVLVSVGLAALGAFELAVGVCARAGRCFFVFVFFAASFKRSCVALVCCFCSRRTESGYGLQARSRPIRGRPRALGGSQGAGRQGHGGGHGHQRRGGSGRRYVLLLGGVGVDRHPGLRRGAGRSAREADRELTARDLQQSLHAPRARPPASGRALGRDGPSSPSRDHSRCVRLTPEPVRAAARARPTSRGR